MRLPAAVWLGCLACASPQNLPDYGGPLLRIDRGGGLSVISEPNGLVGGLPYTMRFASGGVRMPESFDFKGELLGPGDMCPFESLVGTTIFPGTRAIANADVGSGSSQLSVEIEGLAIVRLKVEYSVSYDFCGSAQLLSGTSTFTFSPFGRITRFDTVSPTEVGLPQVEMTGCGCNAINSPYFFTSFWTFQTTAARGPDNQPLTSGEVNEVGGCAVYDDASDRGVGVVWNSTSPVSFPARFQFGQSLAVIYDYQHATDTIPANFTGSSVSRLQLSPTAPTGMMAGDPKPTCFAVMDQVAERPVVIGDEPAKLDQNGFYVGNGTYDNPVRITANAGLNPGFILALDLRGRRHARVSRDGNMDGVFYIPDFDPSTERALFWFRDGLMAGQTVTVEPIDD